MGQFGFSYIGLIYLLMLFIPNLIWAKNQPVDYDASHESKILLVLERVGQIGCTFCALVFSNFNPAPFSAWSVWLIISFLLMILYEIGWIRYFKSDHTEKNFYRSFLSVPVPLAILPVAAFLLLGIYGKVAFMILSALVLGVGHIGIHLSHLKK